MAFSHAPQQCARSAKSVIDRKSRSVAGMDPPLPGPQTSLMSPMVSSSLGPINEFFEWFGDLGIFFWRVLRAAVTPPFEFRELFRQLDEVGSMSDRKSTRLNSSHLG